MSLTSAGNGGASGGRIAAHLSEWFQFQGRLLAFGGKGWTSLKHGAPGTVYIHTQIGDDKVRELWVNNRGRGFDQVCNYPIKIGGITELEVMRLYGQACVQTTEVRLL